LAQADAYEGPFPQSNYDRTVAAYGALPDDSDPIVKMSLRFSMVAYDALRVRVVFGVRLPGRWPALHSPERV